MFVKRDLPVSNIICLLVHAMLACYFYLYTVDVFVQYLNFIDPEFPHFLMNDLLSNKHYDCNAQPRCASLLANWLQISFSDVAANNWMLISRNLDFCTNCLFISSIVPQLSCFITKKNHFQKMATLDKTDGSDINVV